MNMPDSGVKEVKIARRPGHTIRSEYERGTGVPSLLAVHANPTGNCHDIGLSYGVAISGARADII